MEIEITQPRFAFIPRPLEVNDKFELSKFPLNILFGCAWDLHSHALYIPQMTSYLELVSVIGLTYFNEKDLLAKVTIEYHTTNGRWRGTKYYEQDRLGIAIDNEWNRFFIHLTSLGTCRREHLSRSDV